MPVHFNLCAYARRLRPNHEQLFPSRIKEGLPTNLLTKRRPTRPFCQGGPGRRYAYDSTEISREVCTRETVPVPDRPFGGR